MSREHDLIRSEFSRTAATFADRTAGRFDHMDVVGFSGVARAATVVEVGAGTGNFVALFSEIADLIVGIDITFEMLAESRRHRSVVALGGDGAALPLRSRSVDLVASAQALHHIHDPVPVLREMRRVANDHGHVLVVDQVATERLEEVRAMNELDLIRDPSHAACRPASAFRVMLQAAGLQIEREETFESTERFSTWMHPDEFPSERIQAARDFVERRGHETGMGFVADGEDWTFTRRRIMLLTRRAG